MQTIVISVCPPVWWLWLSPPLAAMWYVRYRTVSTFVGWHHVFTKRVPWHIMHIPKQRRQNGWNYCIDSNQILVNDKDQQAHILSCKLGAKSAICNCFNLRSVHWHAYPSCNIKVPKSTVSPNPPMSRMIWQQNLAPSLPILFFFPVFNFHIFPSDYLNAPVEERPLNECCCCCLRTIICTPYLRKSKPSANSA